MITKEFDTLVETLNDLHKKGYKDDFKACDENVEAVYSKKTFNPDELTIVGKMRFDGMTNPSDESEVLVIEANDGTKGTMVISYSTANSQNSDLIKKIKEEA